MLTIIQQLSTTIGESVNVSVIDGDDVVCVARSNSPRLVSIGFHPGARAPAHVVAPGPVPLAALRPASLARRIDAHDFAAFTQRVHWRAERIVAQLLPALRGTAGLLRQVV